MSASNVNRSRLTATINQSLNGLSQVGSFALKRSEMLIAPTVLGYMGDGLRV